MNKAVYYVTDGNGLLFSHIDAGRVWWNNPNKPICTDFQGQNYNPEPYQFENLDRAMWFAELLRTTALGYIKGADVICA